MDVRGQPSHRGRGDSAVHDDLPIHRSDQFRGNRVFGIEFNGQVSGELPLPQEKTDPAAPVVTEEPSFAQVQSGRITGRIYFDPLDRMVVRMIEQSVDLLLTLPGAGAAPQHSGQRGLDAAAPACRANAVRSREAGFRQNSIIS